MKPARNIGLRTIVAVAASALAACGAAATTHGPVQRRPSPVAHARGGPPGHVAVIVMENEEYGEIVGARSTPYINGLAQRYGAGDADVRDPRIRRFRTTWR